MHVPFGDASLFGTSCGFFVLNCICVPMYICVAIRYSATGAAPWLGRENG